LEKSKQQNSWRVQVRFSDCLIIILVGWVNPWSFIPAVIAGGGMIFIRHRFARCLRDLKRIEGISRSPVYSYLTSTIHGLKVIRSYHAEQMCSAQFLAYLDDNTRASYLVTTVNRWAAIRFDWITLSFIAVVTFLAMIVRIFQNQLSAADIALILSYTVSVWRVFFSGPLGKGCA
jgi:ABC-type multidrug transport system fused ATPase/permease subunit